MTEVDENHCTDVSLIGKRSQIKTFSLRQLIEVQFFKIFLAVTSELRTKGCQNKNESAHIQSNC